MAEQQTQQVFDIRKVYVKDASLESPGAPGIFLVENSQPQIDINASIKTSPLEQDDYYEVVLGITVTSKINDDVAFLVEVQQAGVFHIAGFPKDNIPLALQITCPNVLLPFARESVCELVGKAGFPQLLLSPINFEALYQQKQNQEAQAKKEAVENGEQNRPLPN